ncbi:FAD-binding domain-containing protein [Aulographum hederae CBS 113979]|uniref:FAD-binding domain-containing protein n=1 Tax=Aulographum hederae CBS 113979 TaxID=1176131 RepID=A0A6G1H2F1_9PEZI|nr:FAD-binding domain-containing protein [Aulographum hederae CBS 113979]
MFSLRTLALSLLLCSLKPAAASPDPACKAIEEAIPDQITYINQTRYNKENSNYYNAGNSELKPACIVLPTSADSVSKTVKIFNQNPDVKFAIKSGGHDPNPGHSSIHGGVLIAMSQLKGTTYDKAKGVAYVKPGGKWMTVIRELQKDGVAVVGGRIGIYGMGADNVVAFETVVANASIVSVTRENNPDLMRAMRGGGSQFGIVTQFTLQTYPVGKIWAGIRMYGAQQQKEVFEGLHDFIEKNNVNKKAAIIFTASPTAKGSDGYRVFFFYDGPTPPNGTFGRLGDVKPTLDLTAQMTYGDFLGANMPPELDDMGQPAMRTSFRSVTLPRIPNEPGWYAQIENTFSNITVALNKGPFEPLGTLAFQPFPADRFVIEIAHIYADKAKDEIIQQVGREFVKEVRKQHTELVAKNKGVAMETYLPYFMNGASDDGDVFGSYKEVAKFKALQKQNDPDGLWLRSGSWTKYGKCSGDDSFNCFSVVPDTTSVLEFVGKDG